jgi:hypothetical protein
MKHEYKCQIGFYNSDGYSYSRPVYLQIMKCFKKENFIRIYVLDEDKIEFTFNTDDDVYIKLHILDTNETFPNDKSDFRLNKVYNQFHSTMGKKSDLQKKWTYYQNFNRIQWKIKSMFVERDNEYTKEIYQLLEPYTK